MSADYLFYINKFGAEPKQNIGYCGGERVNLLPEILALVMEARCRDSNLVFCGLY